MADLPIDLNIGELLALLPPMFLAVYAFIEAIHLGKEMR